MNFPTPQGISICRNMIAALAVTGLTGDAKLGHLRIPSVAFDKGRDALRDVTVHARAVPSPDRIGLFRFWRHEKSLSYRRPHFFANDVGERKLLERSALGGLGPQNLEVMRASQEHDLSRRSVISRAGRAINGEDLVALTLQLVFPTGEAQLDVIPFGEQCGGGRNLRHGPVKRSVPAGVI